MTGDEEKGIVLVTGASTGIGRATALLLGRSGYTVFAGVRTEGDREGLKAEGQAGLTPLLLDITRQGEILAAREAVLRHPCPPGTLRALVNNAGVVLGGPLEYFSLDALRQEMEVNVLGQIAMVQAFLPWIREGKGRVVLVGSPSGFFAPPFLGPYAASKFALEAVADALRREVRHQGIRVSLVEPGAVETAVWDKSIGQTERMKAMLPPEGRALYLSSLDAGLGMMDTLRRGALPASRVAGAIKGALETRRPKPRYLVGRDARLQWAMARFLPDRLTDWLVEKAMGLRQGQ